MRMIHTFVIKILQDSAHSRLLQGIMTSVANGDQFAFEDGAALLDQIERIVANAGQAGETAEEACGGAQACPGQSQGEQHDG